MRFRIPPPSVKSKRIVQNALTHSTSIPFSRSSKCANVMANSTGNDVCFVATVRSGLLKSEDVCRICMFTNLEIDQVPCCAVCLWQWLHFSRFSHAGKTTMTKCNISHCHVGLWEGVYCTAGTPTSGTVSNHLHQQISGKFQNEK